MNEQAPEIKCDDLPCPVCGSRQFTLGTVERFLHFSPSGESIWRKWLRMLFVRQMKARRCDRCSNLQLFDE